MTQLQAQADALAAQVPRQTPFLLLSCTHAQGILTHPALSQAGGRCPGLTQAVSEQVQALEGLGQENSRLAASNEAIAKHLSSNASPSVSLSTPALCQACFKRISLSLHPDKTFLQCNGVRSFAL